MNTKTAVHLLEILNSHAEPTAQHCKGCKQGARKLKSSTAPGSADRESTMYLSVLAPQGHFSPALQSTGHHWHHSLDQQLQPSSRRNWLYGFGHWKVSCPSRLYQILLKRKRSVPYQRRERAQRKRGKGHAVDDQDWSKHPR
jgi:hypothetical protein